MQQESVAIYTKVCWRVRIYCILWNTIVISIDFYRSYKSACLGPFDLQYLPGSSHLSSVVAITDFLSLSFLSTSLLTFSGEGKEGSLPCICPFVSSSLCSISSLSLPRLEHQFFRTVLRPTLTLLPSLTETQWLLHPSSLLIPLFIFPSLSTDLHLIPPSWSFPFHLFFDDSWATIMEYSWTILNTTYPILLFVN